MNSEQIFQNMKNEIETPEDLDGYEELPEEFQEKVRIFRLHETRPVTRRTDSRSLERGKGRRCRRSRVRQEARRRRRRRGLAQEGATRFMPRKPKLSARAEGSSQDQGQEDV